MSEQLTRLERITLALWLAAFWILGRWDAYRMRREAKAELRRKAWRGRR